MDCALSVRDLSIEVGGEILLERENFDVPVGRIFAILGPSGCGKSTLLRHLIGLDPPHEGEIHVGGIGDPFLYEGPPRFGVTFQSGALFSSLTLQQNMMMPLTTWTALPEAAILKIVRSKLNLVGLRGYENHLPSELSGGMRKRAGIARALTLEPDLLFLDEPSAGLDPVIAAEIDDLIEVLNRQLGVTVVLVTHELESILRTADDCIMLDKRTKGIIARGDPRVLKETSQDPYVHAFFNRHAYPKDTPDWMP
ncbi:MAG: ATP-binding cassette domain-containing protein [Planctomycetes bacterium]|nr:ATP-binding cassette domain-containing protein [Planctomycetota bacterium]